MHTGPSDAQLHLEEKTSLRMDYAEKMWRGGASVRAVSEYLGVHLSRAYEIVRRWKREDVAKARALASRRITEAVSVLFKSGFSCFEISLALNTTEEEITHRLQEAGDIPRPPSDDVDELLQNLNISVRAQSAIRNMGVKSMVELCRLTKDDFKKLRNCGRKTICEIKNALDDIEANHNM